MCRVPFFQSTHLVTSAVMGWGIKQKRKSNVEKNAFFPLSSHKNGGKKYRQRS